MPTESPSQKNAQKYFSKAENSETPLKRTSKKERAANASKTAKLRELRLAKEAADQDDADKLAVTTSGAKKDVKAPARIAARKPLRMIY